MKKRILQLSAVAALVATSASAMAATGTITVSGTVASALSISASTMAFNTMFVSDPSALSTAIFPVTTNSTPVTLTSVMTNPITFSPQTSSASFTITGEASTAVTITWTNTAASGGQPFTLTTLGLSPANPTGCTLSAGGTCTVYYGGRLTIPANQSAGTISGLTNTVTVIY